MAGVKVGNALDGSGAHGAEVLHLVDLHAALLRGTIDTLALVSPTLKHADALSRGIEHALLPEQGLVTAGDAVIGADSHTCTYGALGAFSTGVGSTDMACGMATGKAWFKVPSAIRIYLTGTKNRFVFGKD